MTTNDSPVKPAPVPYTLDASEVTYRLIRTGLATAILDGLFSSILSVAAYGSTFSRLFQGVAATVLGSEAFDGGARTTALGVLMHCGVAFGWSAIFVVVAMRSEWVRRLAASRFGVLGIAAAYGPAIWMVMSLLVIPLLLHRPPTITFRWWVQFFGHFPFVGIPIVGLGSRVGRRSADRLAPTPS
jgi:hypothetical protein